MLYIVIYEQMLMLYIVMLSNAASEIEARDSLLPGVCSISNVATVCSKVMDASMETLRDFNKS